MSARGYLIATVAGGPAIAISAVAVFAFGRWFAGLIARPFETRLTEAQRLAANNSGENR